MLRYGAWMGGDRDGNPFVTPDVTVEAIRQLRSSALRRHTGWNNSASGSIKSDRYVEIPARTCRIAGCRCRAAADHRRTAEPPQHTSRTDASAYHKAAGHPAPYRNTSPTGSALAALRPSHTPTTTAANWYRTFG